MLAIVFILKFSFSHKFFVRQFCLFLSFFRIACSIKCIANREMWYINLNPVHVVVDSTIVSITHFVFFTYPLNCKIGCFVNSKYDSEYNRVLNMKELHRVLNISQYGWICLNRTWMYLNMSKFTIIDRVLIMYHTIHSTRSLSKSMSTYWEINIFRTQLKI